MNLATGTRIGPYEITGALGAGGMGTVYRARETRLGRDVAITALPDLHRGDRERVARFRREAQILAALNHPHIAAIYGVEEIDGSELLILELVDGQTLADRLTGGPLAEDDALAVARQLADALHAAHDKGIVHRDLKPANIALTGAGQAKVLDFGLGKALEPDASGAGAGPTITSAPTEAGLVLGTAAYMSPEQARGVPVDKRADIWAFGCVLFEMLAGTRAFRGSTSSEAMAAVLEREPEWSRLPTALRPEILRLLRRCLVKDPGRRLHDLADARIEIEDALAEPRATAAAAPAVRRSSRERAAWAVATIVLTALVGVLLFDRLPRRTDQPSGDRSYAVSIVAPDPLRLWFEPAGRFALSPDGARIVFSGEDAGGRTMLYLRPLDSSLAQPLPGTEGGAFPFWSPDSRSVAFLSQGNLKRLDLALGQVVTLGQASFRSTGAWLPDGSILFTPTGESPLFRVSSAAGPPTPATALDSADGEVQHSYPFVLPDGRHFLYFAVGRKGNLTEARGVFVGALDGKTPGKLLLPRASNAKYAREHVLFIRDGALLAQRFDLNRLEVTGEAVPIAEQVQVSSSATSGAVGGFSVAANGTLAFQAGSVVRSQLAWYTLAGVTTGTVGAPADLVDVALSPDGSRAAVSLLDPALGTRDIWLYDLRRGLPERFTFDPGDEIGPNWMPGGARIVFTARRQAGVHLYEKPANGIATEKLLWSDDLGKFNPRPSSDGRFVAYVAGGGVIGRSDVWVLPLSPAAADRKPYAFADSPVVETHPQFSPDGRWLAYTSRQTGRDEVHVASFPGREVTRQVSIAGGGFPRWSRSGRGLFYLRPDNMLMLADVDGTGSDFHVTAERALFAAPQRLRTRTRLDAFPYDVHPDGERILVNQELDDASSATITLVINWKASR